MSSAIAWPEIHPHLAIIRMTHSRIEVHFACQGRGYALLQLSKGLQADNSAIQPDKLWVHVKNSELLS
jgi:hypothetical protein